MAFFNNLSRATKYKNENELIKKNSKLFIKTLTTEVETLNNEIETLKKINTSEHIKSFIIDLYSSTNKLLDCPICFNKIKPNDDLVITACGHYYCRKCYGLQKKCSICNYLFS